MTNERTLGIIDDVIHHYFSFWKDGEKYGKKPELQTKQNYKDYYTLANLDEANAVIEFEKNEDESTVEEWATYAAREACKNAPLDLFADDIITADAYTARNSRVWNAYGEGTGDMDVWITGIAKGH